jgi:predicted GNAT family acetyltransferase
LFPPSLVAVFSLFRRRERLDLANDGGGSAAAKGDTVLVGNDPPPGPSAPVRHDPDHSRFFLPLADGDAELIYAPFSADVLDLQHTDVPPSGQGRGIGDALVRAALGYAREQGMRVMATCPYVQAWLRKHPEERPS